MTRMIERLGGQPSVSPSMKEVALEAQADVVEFAQRLITGASRNRHLADGRRF